MVAEGGSSQRADLDDDHFREERARLWERAGSAAGLAVMGVIL